MAFEIQAHRGGRSRFPENTLQAFCHAAALGIRVVELDLVITKDHQIIVSHDPWLSAPHCADRHGQPLTVDDRLRYIVYEMMYDDITSFDCGLPDPSFPGQVRVRTHKPLLSTVFREVEAFMAWAGIAGGMIYNLEIKSWPDKDDVFHPSPDRYASLLVTLVEASGLSSRVRIQSFDERVVRESWRLNARLCYGLLIDEVKNPGQLLGGLGFIPRYVNPGFSLVDREMIDAFQAEGIGMIPWTVNRTEEMLAMKQAGAEGIITDYPEQAIALFGLSDQPCPPAA